MYKGGKIIAALIVFVVFLTLPFFYNMGRSNAGPENLDSAIQVLGNKQCVEPAEFMRANHMKLLNQWRDAYVRDGQTVYVNSQGKPFEISLDTCLKCHSADKTSSTEGVSTSALNASDKFCVSCHNYAAVKLTCWSCHSEPKEATK